MTGVLRWVLTVLGLTGLVAACRSPGRENEAGRADASGAGTLAKPLGGQASASAPSRIPKNAEGVPRQPPPDDSAVGSKGDASTTACVTLAAVGAVRLDATRSDGDAGHGALRAARAELLRLLERPTDYYAVVEGGADLVLVELWHSPADALATCVSALQSEKNRTLVYDPRTRRVVSTSFRFRKAN